MTTIASILTENGNVNIIAVGGDGTVNKVLNGIKNFNNINFGTIPCGTGNDFAKSLNLPKNPVKAVQFIIDNKPTFTDFLYRFRTNAHSMFAEWVWM